MTVLSCFERLSIFPKVKIFQKFKVQLNQIDDYDMVWINGKIGETFGRHNFRNYDVDTNSLERSQG